MRVVLRTFCGLVVAGILPALLAHTACAAAYPMVPQSSGAYTSFSDEQYNVGGQAQSPQDMLKEASALATKGNLESAQSLANKAYETAKHDPRLVINYIEALIAMVKLDGEESDRRLLNSAINAANELHRLKLCSGQGDAELGYHFMVALGTLGDETMGLNKRIACQLYSAQGEIAKSLLNNPGYPSQSLNVLGGPIMNLARAQAIGEDEAAAFDTISQAFEVGFTKFEETVMDPAFAGIDQMQLKRTVQNHRMAYKRKLVQWSREELNRFSRFEISFDVANVNGGRVSSDGLKGKIAVVDLWATWCAPCREGIPHFVKLDRDYRHKNVVVVGISMDEPSDPASAVDAVKNFAMDEGIDYVLGVGTSELKAKIPGRMLLPTTLFLDANGTVRYIASGYHDYMQLEALTKALAEEAKTMVASQSVSSEIIQ